MDNTIVLLPDPMTVTYPRSYIKKLLIDPNDKLKEVTLTKL